MLFTRHSTLEPGIITRVDLIPSDNSPGGVDTYSYDIDLDAGGSLIGMSEHIMPDPKDP